MQMTKRIISIVLTLVLLSSMVYVPAGAAETSVQTDTGEVTVSGTNGFGELLSDEIESVQTQQEQAAEGFEVGYAVTGLEFSGNTATVTCEAKESALVVVAVYTEDGMQLLLSGTAAVGPETTQALVTIQGEMPQYFYAAAYLMDPESYSPLCSSYTTPLYTQEMQQLLSSTVEDYDADRVYNLDGDNTTNFAVFGDDVILIREQEGVNTVISADDENKIYVLENPDATVTGLVEGNVVAYCYGNGQILMIKVASVQISGSTVTITGGELQMEDVFSYVKIEENASGSEMTVDTAEADEGITYEGTQGGAARAAESETTTKWAHVFKLDKTLPADGSSEDAKREAEFKGSLTFGLDLSVKYYIALKQQYFDAKIDGRISLTGSISGKAEFENIKLGRFDCALVPGVYVHMKPAVAIHFEGEASIEASYTYTLGFAVENGWGKGLVMQNRTTKPKLDAVLKFEGSLFFGVDMNPSISILSDGVAKAEMTDLIGLEIKGKIEKSAADALDQDAEVHHGCSACLAGEVDLKLSVSVDVQLLDREELSLDLKLLDLKAKLTDFYWSQEHGTFALTTCPYRSYRVAVSVTDAEGNAVADTAVTMSNEDTANTDENGIAIFYLPAGMYTVSAVIDETEYDVRFYVKHAARKVALDPYAEDEVFTTLDPDAFWQLSNIIATGQCGPTVYWALYDDGLLYIYGEGDMYGYTSGTPSWDAYKDQIIRVLVEDGVTRISRYTFDWFSNLTEVYVAGSVRAIVYGAFSNCVNLETVVLNEGLVEIDQYAFQGCTKLANIQLPSTLKDLRYYAFNSCVSLREITIPCWVGGCAFEKCASLEKVTFLDTATSVMSGGFRNCDSLKEVHFGNSIYKLESYAFYDCDALTEIHLPDSMTIIDQYAFADCDALVTAQLNEGLLEISSYAFDDCGNLATVNLPSTLTNLRSHAFYKCKSLKEVTIPCYVGGSAFYGCSALEKVTLLEGARYVGTYAFAECYSLREVTLAEGMDSVDNYAFYNCDSLTQIRIPASITIIDQYAFSKCDNLTAVELNEGLLEIASNAFAECGQLADISIPTTVNNLRSYAFYRCGSLKEVTIPCYAGSSAFYGCSALEKVTFLEGATSVGSYAFAECTALREVNLAEGMQTVKSYAFQGCTALTQITIPSTVTEVESNAFNRCKNLTEIRFRGDAPKIGSSVFYNVTATAYYPQGNATWTADVMKDYGGTITWVPYTPETGAAATTAVESATATAAVSLCVMDDRLEEAVSPNAFHDGESVAEIIDGRAVHTAVFEDLAPGEEYVLLVLVSMEVEDPLAADNLLYITQGTAAADGTLVFEYVQRVETTEAYVMVCGPATRNINDAVITFPEMAAEGGHQTVNPTVVYDGETLTEGVDYIITGTVDYDAPGEYVCYIEGIHNYTGVVECSYTVSERFGITGDVNGDEEVDVMDANLVIAYYYGNVELDEAQLLNADVNGDGEIDVMDANLIIAYYYGNIDRFPVDD